MRKAIIIYNEKAGFGNNSLDKVEEAVKEEGFSISSYSKKSEDLPTILQQECDLVVVTGGDGTVKSVATHLKGRNVPLYIWPAGSSNNIATTYGTGKKELDLKSLNSRGLNTGILQVNGKSLSFLESAGAGIISDMMKEMIEEVNYRSKEEKINKSLEVLQKKLMGQKEFELRLFIDDESYHDQYLAVEMMNTCYAGPQLLFAPEADPGDDFLDVVLIGRKQADELEKYLSDRLSGKRNPPSFPVYRAKKIKMMGKGLHIHADDDLLFTEEEGEVVVSLEEKKILVLA